MVNVGILLFDEVEVLDFAGPFEVFSTASRLALRQHVTRPREVTCFLQNRETSSCYNVVPISNPGTQLPSGV